MLELSQLSQGHRRAARRGDQHAGQCLDLLLDPVNDVDRADPVARDVLYGLLKFVEQLFAKGRSCAQILEVLMPA